MKLLKTYVCRSVAAAAVALLFACYSEIPAQKAILSEEQLLPVLKEIHLAEALLTEIVDKQQKDSMSHYYYQHILQQHNISKEDFDQSMNAYFSNPQALDSLYQKIIQAISDEKKQQDAKLKDASQDSKKR